MVSVCLSFHPKFKKKKSIILNTFIYLFIYAACNSMLFCHHGMINEWFAHPPHSSDVRGSNPGCGLPALYMFSICCFSPGTPCP